MMNLILQRPSIIRKFETVCEKMGGEGYKFYNDKENIHWLNYKAKVGSRNLNFYAFDSLDFSQLNTFLNEITHKEERLEKLGYDLEGIKSFNRNVWIDLSRESGAIEGIFEDFSYDLFDFRTKLRGEITIDPSTENFDVDEYFKKMLHQYEKVEENNDNYVIVGKNKTHRLGMATIRHFIAFKYVYKCAKLFKQGGEIKMTADDFENILKNASALMSGNYSVAYRQDPAVVTDAEWRPAKPNEIYDKMHALCEWVVDGKQSGRLHPIEKAAIFHAEFIRIHPFADGNGRTGRIMANYILMNSEMPTVSLRRTNTEEYFKALNKAILTHEIDDLINMFYEYACCNAKKIDACLDYIEKTKKPKSQDVKKSERHK